MKISKLFHWLYAILMLLPFLVFLPNAFYYGFNEHAVAQEKTEQVPVYYDTNEISSIDDFTTGNVYSWNNNLIINYRPQTYYLMSIKVLSGIYQDNTCSMLLGASGNLVLYIDGVNNNVTNSVFDFIYLQPLNNFNDLPNDVLQHYSNTTIQYVKEYQDITTSMSITDSMSYAWNSVWQNDLFSWSYGSFLTEPFIYIGNVFNVPVDNTLYYALSYWLDISIIWLCFDMVMYIPLLVHRWLDKGIIE